MIRSASTPPLDARLAHRALDVAASLLALVLTAPVALLIAIAIRCESSGPVLVRTMCIGRDRRLPRSPSRGERRLHDAGGELFVLHSFRIAREGSSPEGATSEPTRTGRWLAATGFEHLPGLFAVLAGHLSLVGPRPLPARWVVRLNEWIPELPAALAGSRPGLIGPGPGRLPAGDSPDVSLVAALARRVLVDLPAAARWRGVRGPFDAVARDVAALVAAPWRRRSRRPGHDVVRFEHPARFHQIPISPEDLAARLQEGQSADVERRDDGTVTWWYPLRRPAFAGRARLATGGREIGAGLALTAGWCDSLHLFDPWEVVVVRDLQPLPGPEDVLGCEIPVDLNGIESACEHLMPVWRSLAWRDADSDLAVRLTVALIESAARLAASSRSRDDRISVTVTVGSNSVKLRARLQLASASVPVAVPTLSLGHLAETVVHQRGPVTPG